MKQKLVRALVVLAGALVAIQVVPIGRDHTNPAVVLEPTWDRPETRALAKRACFDCHSNETVWPWYASVAPASWIVSHHVDEGREHLNFSTWNVAQKHAKEAGEEVEEGEMPMPPYVMLHAEAKLTDDEKKALIAGLEATVKAHPPGAAAAAPSDAPSDPGAPPTEPAKPDDAPAPDAPTAEPLPPG